MRPAVFACFVSLYMADHKTLSAIKMPACIAYPLLHTNATILCGPTLRDQWYPGIRMAPRPPLTSIHQFPSTQPCSEAERTIQNHHVIPLSEHRLASPFHCCAVSRVRVLIDASSTAPGAPASPCHPRSVQMMRTTAAGIISAYHSPAMSAPVVRSASLIGGTCPAPLAWCRRSDSAAHP
jgi:hypothetical protein